MSPSRIRILKTKGIFSGSLIYLFQYKSVASLCGMLICFGVCGGWLFKSEWVERKGFGELVTNQHVLHCPRMAFSNRPIYSLWFNR